MTGHTRSANRPDHLLHTPDAFVRTPLPGLTGGWAIVHASPAGGAAFTQYTIELEPGGIFEASGIAGLQRFVYVVSGTVNLSPGAIHRPLNPGGFAYIPAATPHAFTATVPTVLEVIEKLRNDLPGSAPPQPFIGRESDVAGLPLGGDDGLLVRALMPAGLGYDFAVNTMTYAPGASLAQVEVHVMEHGCTMLEGGGIYRLSDRWYPVAAGDFLWMGPYCPQWFGALGKVPAKYLIYKDFNRHPMA